MRRSGGAVTIMGKAQSVSRMRKDPGSLSWASLDSPDVELFPAAFALYFLV